ncbi:NAD dependent epimerase/dehydratase [Aspergillus flavus AF70]|nr:NAD dependent epimerase/dehydratase [Aspergillus flavus AF70]
MAPTVLVTGATGYQGFGTARHLLAAGIQVNALVRDPSKPKALELEQLGAKLCVGTFDDPDSLRAAAQGTLAVFLNVMPTIPDFSSELQHAKNVVNAAKEAGTVTSIIYSSVTMTGKHETFPGWGADYPMAWYWTSKAAIESLVRASGFRYWTILRPAFLMYNYLSPTADHMFPSLPSEHVFRTAYKPDSPMTILDPDDVGKFATAAILDPEMYNQHEIDLGAQALTPDEIARALSQASGKDIKVEFYTADKAASLSSVNPMITAQLWSNDVGYQVDMEALKKYPIKLTTFSEYLHREKCAVQKTFG